MKDSGGTPSTGGPAWVSVREDEYVKMRARIAALEAALHLIGKHPNETELVSKVVRVALESGE